MKGRLTLVLGGSRSGKSEFAEKLAGSYGKQVVYIATAAAGDSEMTARIILHRSRRSAAWQTVEEEKEVPGILDRNQSVDVYLLDCATVWITNLLIDDNLPHPGAGMIEKEAYVIEEAMRLAVAVENGVNLIVVSSEVGMGIVPEYPLGRQFRDIAGKVNQELAARADRVYLVVAGLPLELKSLARKDLNGVDC